MSEGEAGRGSQAVDVLGHGPWSEPQVDEVRGGLFQDPGGAASRVALDLASGRIRGVVGETQPAKGGRIHPGGVAVVRLNRPRPVGGPLGGRGPRWASG